MLPGVIELLKEIKNQNPDTKFVLPMLEKWDKGEQAREQRIFLMALGLPKIRFHDLRATWTAIMIKKGIPVSKIMSMGVCEDLKTMQIYFSKAGANIKGIT
ncbi:MAG TPA: tyrosine-type recombinase/integrase [Bacteriovoracaceae bacterium]|nr:tyrosine-type recombinase/integrase [Bacteriovoracaceae bacterium]